MAIYHEDIADINLNGGSLHRSFKTVNIGSGDQNANRFGMRVYRNGEAVDLSGVSCQAVFQDPMGNNIALTNHGAVSGNTAYVTLPQACYNYEGRFCLAIKLIGGGVTGTMRIVDGVINNTHTGGAVAPTSAVPTYQEVLAAYDDAIAAVETVEELNTKITKYTGNDEIEFTSGGYIALSGTTADVNTVVANASWRRAVVSCNPGDKFTINATGGSAPRAWGFLSSNGTVLDVAPAGVTLTNVVITAPANAVYLVINDNSESQSYHGELIVRSVADNSDIISDVVDSNVLYKINNIKFTGTNKLIFTVNNPTAGNYGMRVEKVTGHSATSPLYIYIWDADNTRRTVSTNTRDGDAYIVNANVLPGDTKIEFHIYAATSGTATATFEHITIYKGTQERHTVKTDAVMTAETVEQIKQIANDEIADYDSITPQQTTFFYTSKNLLDPTNVVVGEYVNQTNGNFVENDNHERTGYIVIKPQTKYLIKTSRIGYAYAIRYAFYDAQKAYISGYYLSSAQYYVVQSPQNAAYIAFSADPFFFPMMLAQSETDVDYEAYGTCYLMPQYITDSVDDVLLNMPSKIYATSGIECNIYFENITENWDKYAWNVDCAKGEQLERGYRITPVDADAGTYTLTISISPKSNLSVSKQVQTTLVITAASAGSGVTKSVIVLGDSTTYNGTVISKLHENFSGDVMGISTLGTMGTSPNNHEGRSGWTLNDYFTKAYITYPAGDPRGTIYNPFYNPTSQTFDASYYFANSGVSKPDWFFINMGINDMFSYIADDALDTQIATCIGYLNSMITSIKNASENTKIGICVTIPPNASQDAFGKAYSCGQTRNRYKHNNAVWAAQIISEFYDMESNGVYIIPIHTNLDTVYNMGLETLPVNARNTDVTYQSPIGNGGVHPAGVGYWQIADVYFAFIKAHASD